MLLTYTKNLAMLLCMLSTSSIFFTSELIAQNTLKGDALFGAMRARHVGPALMSGRVTDMESHPSDSNIIYIGTAGGGVWKSTDGGVTYNSIFDDYCQSIGVVSIDPSDPDNTVWVGTGEIWTRNSVSYGDGLYKTDNGGKSWTKIGFENSDRIASIQINPNNSNEVYVGVLGALWGDSEDRGIYKTTDGGETWDKILYINETTGCSDLTIDPNEPSTVYAAMWEFRRTAYSFNSGGANSALYKSTDGGATWRKIHNGYPSGDLGRIAVAVAPSQTNTLYSVIEAENKEDKGLYRSDDGGETWVQKSNDFELTVRPFYFSRLVVDPKNPEKVVKAGLLASISEDGGETFRTIGSGVHPDIHDFSFDPHNSDRMYLASDGGTYRSWDGGTVWEMVKGLPLSQFYHVTVDNDVPFNVYGGLQDNGSWIGPSASHAGIEAGDWKSVGMGDGFRVYPNPKDNNIVYSEMQGADMIWRVNLEKNQSRTIQPFADEGEKLRFNWNTPITTSTNNADRLYVGSQFLHVSNDRGDSWQKISGDLTTNDPAKQQQAESGGLSADNSGAENHCTIFTIAESPINEQVIWIGTDDGNVQLTKNGGKDWTNLRKNIQGLPDNTWVYHIEASSHDVNTAYAVFDGHTQNDYAVYIYKTTDGGASWTSISTEDLHGVARSIQEDFVNPDLLYLGTELGLFVTIDGGQNWSKFNNNMPAVAVHHVTLHPRDHALVMGTHGRGVIIIDDVRPLRELTQDVLTKDVHFFDLGQHVMKEQGGFAGSSVYGGFGGTATYGEFVGANPSTAAEIVYFLKKRHTFGKMKLELFDTNGNLVTELPAGKQKGINKVQWNMLLKRPKVAVAKTLSYGGFSSPRVSPGTYNIKLTKGKQVYESTIELVYDPESIHSVADRDYGHEVAMQLYHMNEDLAYVIDQVDKIHEKATPLSTHSNATIKESAEQLLKNIDSYKENKVITTGDNYVGAAEPQLREKLADLFSEVAGQIGKPSGAQLKNLKLMSTDLQKAKDELKSIVNQKDTLNELLSDEGVELIQLRSKQEFLDAEK